MGLPVRVCAFDAWSAELLVDVVVVDEVCAVATLMASVRSSGLTPDSRAATPLPTLFKMP